MTTWIIGAAALLAAGAGTQAQDSRSGATMGTMPMPGERVPAPAMNDGMRAAAARCPATPATLPPELAGWTTMTPATATTAAAAAPVLPIGRGARVTLADVGAVRFAVAPGHAPAAGSRGGLVAFDVAAAGRYRVALGAGAWVDLVQGGTALPSVAHGHGPACTTLKKMVDFDLRPGRYLLQLSGNAEPVLAVMMVRVAS